MTESDTDGMSDGDTQTREAPKFNEGGRMEPLQEEHEPVCPAWTRFTENAVHTKVPNAVERISMIAVRNPLICILVVVLLSFGLAGVGFYTNFSLEVDDLTVFTPFGVRPRSHLEWIENEFSSSIPVERRIFVMVHAEGDNVVYRDTIRRVWDVMKVVTETPGYNYVCTKSNYVDPVTGLNNCEISTVTRFWDNSLTIFEEQVRNEDELRNAISASDYPDGVPVDTETIIGKATTVDGIITQAESYFVIFFLPDFQGRGPYSTKSIEEAVPDRLLALQEKWDDEGYGMTLDFFTERSYESELQRAIEKDIPLVPLVFIIMTIFTCSIFARRERVQSRMLLGVGAVVTILMSLMTSYGIMFCCGVPFTNMTQLVPFVIFGVGLDDTFIIVGSFFRTDANRSIEERVSGTMKDVGLSIFVTTFTTAFAFALGSISNIPAVRWLCAYAILAITVDFIYQITFFIALMVLDERRIQANRGDLCCCCVVEDPVLETEDGARGESKPVIAPQPNFIDRFMVWYAEQLLRPCVKVLVLVVFTALLGGCAYSTALLRQEFRVTELLPDGSYVTSFFDVFQVHYTRSLPLNIYFRFVDQSDPAIREQMVDYVDSLAALPQFDDNVPFCWVKDLPKVLSLDQFSYLQNSTFNEQLDELLGYRQVQEIYGENLLRDDNGDIIASRCFLFLSDLKLDVVQDQIDLLHDQRSITEAQEVNQGRSDWAFFTFDNLYMTWEFYDAVVGEWIFTTISGVVAVTAISFVFLPHWTSIFFVFPMIVVLYIDLIGTIQFAGLYINVVTHVALAMSIGLLVDYIIHVLLRYYETPGRTREEKVKECLRTMGSAVLIGGLSTLLGVVPLAFSTSEVMRTVFISFVSMVTIGCGHGLIFLPVVLSICGPVNHLPPSGETVLQTIVGTDEARTDQSKEEVTKTVIESEYPFLLPARSAVSAVSAVSSRKADPPGAIASESDLGMLDPDDCDPTDRYSDDGSGISSEMATPAAVVTTVSEESEEIETFAPPNSLTADMVIAADSNEETGQMCDVAGSVSALLDP